VAWAGYTWFEVQWWVPAVAIGLTLSNTVAVVLRGWGLRSRLGGIDGKRVALMHLRALVAAAASAGVGVVIMFLGPDSFEERGWGAVATSAAVLAVGGTAMLFTYLAVARLVKLGEVN